MAAVFYGGFVCGWHRRRLVLDAGWCPLPAVSDASGNRGPYALASWGLQMYPGISINIDASRLEASMHGTGVYGLIDAWVKTEIFY